MCPPFIKFSIHCIQYPTRSAFTYLHSASEANSHSRGVTAHQPSTRRTDLIGVDRLLATSDRDPD